MQDDDLFTELVKNLREDEVAVDPHIENLLIFPQHPEFHTYWMVEQKYLILQDKVILLFLHIVITFNRRLVFRLFY